MGTGGRELARQWIALLHGLQSRWGAGSAPSSDKSRLVLTRQDVHNQCLVEPTYLTMPMCVLLRQNVDLEVGLLGHIFQLQDFHKIRRSTSGDRMSTGHDDDFTRFGESAGYESFVDKVAKIIKTINVCT